MGVMTTILSGFLEAVSSSASSKLGAQNSLKPNKTSQMSSLLGCSAIFLEFA